MKKNSLLKKMWKHRVLYLFILPTIVSLFIFSYIPIFGNVVAFKDYSFGKGIWGSDWVGFDYFIQFFNYYQFEFVVWNTLKISFLKIFLVFPMPILFALFLNELGNARFKKTIQSVSYLPHFVSWVVVVNILTVFISPHDGLINNILLDLGIIDEAIFFMGLESWFYPLVFITDVYKNIGWSSIIYLAALAGVNQDLYEAASIDGAGRLKKVIHITIPSIIPTIILLFILQFKGIFSAGFDQIFLLQTPGNFNVSETLDIFVFRQGLLEFNISYSTAVGLLISVMSLILMVVVNYISKKTTEQSLW